MDRPHVTSSCTYPHRKRSQGFFFFYPAPSLTNICRAYIHTELHRFAFCHSENIPLGPTTPIEMVEEELLLNQDGHHGKKEQPPPSTSTILSSSTKSITTTLPSFSLRKQLPQGFGYISGGFEVEKLSSNSVTNNAILGEFGEKDESQVTDILNCTYSLYTASN